MIVLPDLGEGGADLADVDPVSGFLGSGETSDDLNVLECIGLFL